MTQIPEAHDAKRFADDIFPRLARRRWLLAAALAALLVLHYAEGGSLWLLGGLFVVVIAAACLPRDVKPARRTDDAPARAGGGDLSAEALVEVVAYPLIVVDQLGAVTMRNRAAASAFGAVDPGASLFVRFRAPEMQQMLEALLSGRTSGATIDYVERLPLSRLFHVTASALGDARFALLFEDRSEARRIDRMRADFIANASHELRTPLASIAGFIETLRGPARNDAAAREQFLQIMQGQTARMSRLIDDLLSLSRLEAKGPVAPDERVDLAKIIAEVVATLAPMAEANGVTIENVVNGHKLEVTGSRDELTQVFENLIENACKYGCSGGSVLVSLAGGANDLAIEVRDFGEGIAEEHIPRLTERFYRVDAENTRARKGAGLGLAIVKHILTRHGGRLAIASKMGEGAAFTVHLPRP